MFSSGDVEGVLQVGTGRLRASNTNFIRVLRFLHVPSFIYRKFASRIHDTALNTRAILTMNWERCKMKRSWPVLRYRSNTLPRGARHDSECQNSPFHPEIKTRYLPHARHESKPLHRNVVSSNLCTSFLQTLDSVILEATEMDEVTGKLGFYLTT